MWNIKEKKSLINNLPKPLAESVYKPGLEQTLRQWLLQEPIPNSVSI